jgi:hypothetical protein
LAAVPRIATVGARRGSQHGRVLVRLRLRFCHFEQLGPCSMICPHSHMHLIDLLVAYCKASNDVRHCVAQTFAARKGSYKPPLQTLQRMNKKPRRTDPPPLPIPCPSSNTLHEPSGGNCAEALCAFHARVRRGGLADAKECAHAQVLGSQHVNVLASTVREARRGAVSAHPWAVRLPYSPTSLLRQNALFFPS